MTSPLFFKQVSINGERVLIPYSSSLFEITAYGEIMHEIKFSLLRHNLTFTPRNNEFILKLNSKSFSSGTKGLCGKFEVSTFNSFLLGLELLFILLFILLLLVNV